MILIHAAKLVEWCLRVRQKLYVEFLRRLVHDLQRRRMRLHLDVLGLVVGVVELLDEEFDLMTARGDSLRFQRGVGLAAILLNTQ
jgi:hypothetical protein